MEKSISINKDTKTEQRNNKDSVGYQGSVVIELKSKNGKIRRIRKKNSGRLGLLKFILYCLSGISSSSMYQPNSLMCCNGKPDGSETEIKYKSLTNPVPYTGIPYIDQNGKDESNPPTITYCFEIPYNKISERTKPITRLCLVNALYSTTVEGPEDSNSYCAEIDLKEAEIITPDAETNIVIYWTLVFRV